jgi:hypothetical protein
MATWILIFCSVCSSSLSFIRARTHLLSMEDEMCVLRGSTCLESDALREHGQLAELCNKNLQVRMYCFCLVRSDASFPRFNLAPTIMDLTCLDQIRLMDNYFTMVAAAVRMELCWGFSGTYVEGFGEF